MNSQVPSGSLVVNHSGLVHTLDHMGIKPSCYVHRGLGRPSHCVCHFLNIGKALLTLPSVGMTLELIKVLNSASLKGPGLFPLSPSLLPSLEVPPPFRSLLSEACSIPAAQPKCMGKEDPAGAPVLSTQPRAGRTVSFLPESPSVTLPGWALSPAWLECLPGGGGGFTPGKSQGVPDPCQTLSSLSCPRE